MNKKKIALAAAIAVIVLAAIIIVVILAASEKDTSGEAANEKMPPAGLQVQAYLASASPQLEEDDLVLGSRDADLKIFVYEDGSSLYSAQLADTLDRIRLEKGDDLALVIRPYAAKGDDNAREAALAVYCAADQEKWPEMRAWLFARAKSDQLGVFDIAAASSQLGLDQEDLAACLTNQEKSAKIEELRTAAATYDVIGAPTVFVGDDMIIGARPYDDYTDSNGDKIEGLSSLVSRKLGR